MDRKKFNSLIKKIKAEGKNKEYDKESNRIFEENLEISRDFVDRYGEVSMLRRLAELALYHGDIPLALSYLEECRSVDRNLGDEELNR
jgi:hypothetical protein